MTLVPGAAAHEDTATLDGCHEVRMEAAPARGQQLPAPFSLQGLALFRGGVLMVSHDQHLIESTVDELWAVEQGTGAAPLLAPLILGIRNKRTLHRAVGILAAGVLQ